MDFFNSQESLTAIQWILRAIVSFYFLLFAVKMMGKRAISQLRLLDFIMALIIGNIIAHPLSDEQLGLKGSMITTSVLVILYLFNILLMLRWRTLRNFIEKSPFALIENGEIKYKNLLKARISIDYLLSELRKEKVEDVQKVSLALWESDGTISIFLKPKYQAITSEDMQLTPKAFNFPTTVIKEREINFTVLNQSGKDEKWLKERIKATYNAEINDILLATIDKNDNLKVFLYK